MEDTYQDQIDAYLLNRMTDQERRLFEQEVANNPTLRKQLDYTRQIQRAITDINEKRKLIAAWNQEDPVISVASSRQHHWLWWCSGVAAILVIGFFVGRKIYIEQDYTYQQIDLATYKGGGSNQEIEQALLKKQYDEALALTDSTIGVVRQEIAALESKPTMRPDEKEYLRAACEQRLQQLEWFQANALIGLKRTKEAKVLLEKLRQQEGAIPAAADSLLQTLK